MVSSPTPKNASMLPNSSQIGQDCRTGRRRWNLGHQPMITMICVSLQKRCTLFAMQPQPYRTAAARYTFYISKFATTQRAPRIMSRHLYHLRLWGIQSGNLKLCPWPPTVQVYQRWQEEVGRMKVHLGWHGGQLQLHRHRLCRGSFLASVTDNHTDCF